MLVEKIKAVGHRNVTARHKTTLEITKEDHLTPRGDCIIAISADRSLSELSRRFRGALKSQKAKLEITLSCSNLTEKITACGDPNLTLRHPTDMVIRKSSFICERTLAIKANKAAIDLNREFVKKLREGEEVEIELRIID
ncbi:MAG: hypothetical protein B6U86_03865 [Candidatus Altiarchaeales archaeon ex4484_43]|nr:MAG: hypothetical protein B6U86_03865 [Candidatus Altiarchaeales archaeon ex4484_43]RLI89934.1 MAG: DUF371 domain-containing protein [Candidatus Altiarchaeales archaeon]